MSRKGDTITLSVSPTTKQGLEALALKLGYKWGDKPNISKLMDAIATGEVTILGKADDRIRVQALAETPEVKEFLKLLRKLEK